MRLEVITLLLFACVACASRPYARRRDHVSLTKRLVSIPAIVARGNSNLRSPTPPPHEQKSLHPHTKECPWSRDTILTAIKTGKRTSIPGSEGSAEVFRLRSFHYPIVVKKVTLGKPERLNPQTVWTLQGVMGEVGGAREVDQLFTHIPDENGQVHYIVMKDMGFRLDEDAPEIEQDDMDVLIKRANEFYRETYGIVRMRGLDCDEDDYVFRKLGNGEYVAHPVGGWRYAWIEGEPKERINRHYCWM